MTSLLLVQQFSKLEQTKIKTKKNWALVFFGPILVQS